MKIRIFIPLPVLFLLSVNAHAQASPSEAAGFKVGQILGPLFLAFIVWRLVKYANQQTAYKKEVEQRRKAREAQNGTIKPD